MSKIAFDYDAWQADFNRRKIEHEKEMAARTPEEWKRIQDETKRLINQVPSDPDQQSPFWDKVYNSEPMQDALKRAGTQAEKDRVIESIRLAVRIHGARAGEKPPEAAPIDPTSFDSSRYTWKNWDWLCGHIMVGAPEDIPGARRRADHQSQFTRPPPTHEEAVASDAEEFNTVDIVKGADLYLQRSAEGAWVNGLIGFQLPGMGTVSRSSCGKFIVRGCKGRHVIGGTEAHKSINKAHIRRYRCQCGQFSCPTCVKWVVETKALKTSRKLLGKLIAYDAALNVKSRHNLKLYHWVFSPSPSEHELLKDNMYRKKFIERMYDKLREMGLRGGAMVFHPYRFQKDVTDPYWSPHFHLISAGWVRPEVIKEYSDLTGNNLIGLNPIDTNRDLYNCLRYLYTHTNVPPTRDPRPGITVRKSAGHARRYWGFAHLFKAVEIMNTAETIEDLESLHIKIQSGELMSEAMAKMVDVGDYKVSIDGARQYSFDVIKRSDDTPMHGVFNFGAEITGRTISHVQTSKGTRKKVKRTYGDNYQYIKGDWIPIEDAHAIDAALTGPVAGGVEPEQPFYRRKNNPAASQSALIADSQLRVQPGSVRCVVLRVRCVPRDGLLMYANRGNSIGDAVPKKPPKGRPAPVKVLHLAVFLNKTAEKCEVCGSKYREMVPAPGSNARPRGLKADQDWDPDVYEVDMNDWEYAERGNGQPRLFFEDLPAPPGPIRGPNFRAPVSDPQEEELIKSVNPHFKRLSAQAQTAQAFDVAYSKAAWILRKEPMNPDEYKQALESAAANIMRKEHPAMAPADMAMFRRARQGIVAMVNGQTSMEVFK